MRGSFNDTRARLRYSPLKSSLTHSHREAACTFLTENVIGLWLDLLPGRTVFIIRLSRISSQWRYVLFVVPPRGHLTHVNYIYFYNNIYLFVEVFGNNARQNKLVVVSGLVGRAPNVGECGGRVKPVEYAERKREVAQNCPESCPVKFLQPLLIEKQPMKR